MRKLLGLIFTVVMLLFSITTTVLSAKYYLPFTDVETSAWYFDEVKTAYDEGIMQGKSSSIFDPEAQTTRAEFIKVLCCMSGDDYLGKGTNLAFTDIKVGAWYMDYVGWGVEHDIVKGLPGNKFGPDQPVTRQEMAVFIDRFVKYLEKEFPNDPQIDFFKDAGEVDSWAAEAVEHMRVSGIITGNESGYFKPQDNAIRAEIATVITRLLPLLDNSRQNGTSGEIVGEDELPYSYTIYLPYEYDKSVQYPLIVYITSDSHDGVDIYFENPNSPAHNSVVVVPHVPNTATWTQSNTEDLANAINFIEKKYNTDPARRYITAVSDGTWGAWRVMLLEPEKVAGAILVHGGSVTFWNTTDENGNRIRIINENDINDGVLDIPIYIVHDRTDLSNPDIGYIGISPDYGRWVYEGLIDKGNDNVFLKETEEHGRNIINNFVTKDDISLLEWLFEQRRETK